MRPRNDASRVMKGKGRGREGEGKGMGVRWFGCGLGLGVLSSILCLGGGWRNRNFGRVAVIMARLGNSLLLPWGYYIHRRSSSVNKHPLPESSSRQYILFCLT